MLGQRSIVRCPAVLQHRRLFGTTTDPCLYKVLGLRPTATQSDIKKSFIRLSKELHPDVHWAKQPDKSRELHSRFATVSHAYNVLSDTKTRQEYDSRRAQTHHSSYGHATPRYGAYRGHGTYEDTMPDPAIFDSHYHRMPVVFAGFALSMGLGVVLQWIYLSYFDTPQEKLARQRQSSQAVNDMYDWEKNPIIISSGHEIRPPPAL